MSEPLRRLELRLPVSHPIWSVADGNRATVLKEWLEIGRRLSEIESDLQEIKGGLNVTKSIEKDSGNIVVAEYKQVQQPQSEFDKNIFLSHFK